MSGLKDYEEAALLASIWHRNRIVIYSADPIASQRVFFRLKPFIPLYRTIVLCGEFPKELRYIQGAKFIDSGEDDVQKEAFLQSYAEEETGSPPVQIVYFRAGPKTLRNVLGVLPQGWMATTSCQPDLWKDENLKIQYDLKFDNAQVFLLDPVPENMLIEEMIIDETKSCSPGIKEFKVQVKQSEVHLGFKALLNELESGSSLSESYISEMLNIRHRTLEKIIVIGKRERRMDLSSYIRRTTPDIIGFLKDMESFKELYLACIFEGKDLIGYAKYRDIHFPTKSFFQILDELEALASAAGDSGRLKFVEINTRNIKIILNPSSNLFGFVLESGSNPLMVRYRVEDSLEDLLKKKRDLSDKGGA